MQKSNWVNPQILTILLTKCLIIILSPTLVSRLTSLQFQSLAYQPEAHILLHLTR